MSETREAPPNDFRDPYWRDLIASTEQRVDIPRGLLQSVILFGEKSNNDQTNRNNTRTIFQIIPSTRDLFLRKYGVDAYLSPENAAEVAALHLKESLQRNGGNLSAAVGEYHGSPNRNTWGPRTNAYINSVMVGYNRFLSEGQQQEAPAAGAQAQSEFQSIIAQRRADEQQRSPIAQVYEAYRSGQLTPEEQKQFEDDVRERRIMLPPNGALLGELPPNATRPSRAFEAPQRLLDAYTSGNLSRNERIEFERDVEKGILKIPEGFPIQKTEELGLVRGAIAAVTGSERETEATRTLPDWMSMPEMTTAGGRGVLESLATGAIGGPQGFRAMRDIGQTRGQNLVATIGTMAASPEEAVQIIRAQNPNVTERRDERGNYILRSAIDGKEYVIPPGFRQSDIPRAAGTALAFTPAGRATTITGGILATGATQGGIELTQALAGGEFNPEEVATAAALGGAIPAAARVLPGIGPLATATMERLRLRRPAAAAPELPPQGPGGPPSAGMAAAAPEPPPAGPAGPGAAARPPMPGAGAMPEPPPAAPRPAAPGAAMAPEVPPAAPAAPRPAAPAMSPYDIAQEARAASRGGMGSQAATQRLAAAAAPDPETVAAAQRLGIAEHLQPGHVTTSQAYRALEQVLRSIPGSALRAQEVEGLKAVSSRATQLLDDMGRMPRSDLSATVKTALDDTVTQMETKAEELYNRLREVIPARTEATPESTLQFINRRLENLGGDRADLTSLERRILARLSPKNDGTGPTYTLTDNFRREAGRATRRQGPFKDADTGLAQKLNGLLSDDLNGVAERFGATDLSDAAKAVVRQRKAIENDMTALFGRNLSNSLLARMDQGFQGVTKGDVSKLADFIKAVPKELRQEVMASGLASAFNKAARDGSLDFTTYAKWWKGLEQNRQAMTLIMSNLPRESRQQLRDLAKVSEGISLSLGETIKTGRLGTGVDVIRDQLQPADTLAQRVFQVAQRSAVGAPLEALTTGMGMPGTGLAAGITSALMKTGKSEPLKAADTLLASPEFQSMAKATVEQSAPKMEQAARRMAQSLAFQDFAEKAAAPRELGAATQWIMSATQAAQNLRPEQTQ
jgi:hypothetical protein